jgi:hypothetical protein
MSDALDDIIDVALLVAAAIESCGGDYFVGGSLASSVDGEPRATNDIDFVVDLPMGRVGHLRHALGDDFELDEDMLRDALRRGSSANAFYLPMVLKVDFFGHPHGPFDESEFERRRAVEVRPGQTLFVKAPEDTVVRKLLWFREGGAASDKQWRDIIGVLRAQGERLDVDYIRRWSIRLGVDDLWERAVGDAEG